MNLFEPTAEELLENQLDITQPNHGVEVVIKDDRSVLWVNIDGICALRVCRIPSITVDDQLPPEPVAFAYLYVQFDNETNQIKHTFISPAIEMPNNAYIGVIKAGETFLNAKYKIIALLNQRNTETGVLHPQNYLLRYLTQVPEDLVYLEGETYGP